MKPPVADEETKNMLDEGHSISFGHKPPFTHNKLTHVKSVEELANNILVDPNELLKSTHA